MNLACGVCIEKCVCAHCAGKMGRCSFGTHTVGCDHPRAYTLSSAARKSRVSRFSIHHRRYHYLSPPDTQTLVSRLCGLRSPSRPGSTFLKQQSSTPPPRAAATAAATPPECRISHGALPGLSSHLRSSNRFGDCGSPKVFRVTPYVLYTYRCGCVFLRRTFEGARATPDAASDTMPVCQSDRQTESPCPGSWSHLVADVPPC